MNVTSFLSATTRAALLAVVFATIAGCATQANTPGDSTAGDKHGGLIFNSCAKPVYPAAATLEKREGTVALDFQVAADGTVTGSRVTKSSGSADLDEAALTGIKVCKFYPTIYQGKPIADSVKVQYVWTLK